VKLAAYAGMLKRHEIGGAITRTAFFNVATAAGGALSGVILARLLGPTARGEYTAVNSWFGMLLMVGGAGQPAAVCFFVARYPRRATAYLATSRGMMLTTGMAALTGGYLIAPALAHGDAGLAEDYRIAFAGSVIAFVGASYTFSLQARSIRRWNLVRVSQPVLSLAGIMVLWWAGLLSLRTAIEMLIVGAAIQFCFAYYCCLRSRLAPGSARLKLVRPLARYGVAQMAALAPASVNLYLDKLVLSQTVPAAELGRYSIAVSITVLPIPLVSAIGNVAFPRLAARHEPAPLSRRQRRTAILATAGISAAIVAPIAASAYWLIPLVFGTAYASAVPLLWILTPGGVLLACNQVAGDLLRGLGRPGLVAAAEGLAAVATLALLVALLPSMGVAAAALASTIAYGIALMAMLRGLRQASADDGGAKPLPSARRNAPDVLPQ
jgi:O-antigen/teichoic acid export membrane protein